MPKITGELLLKSAKKPITLISGKKGHKILINEKREYYYIPVN